MLERLSGTNKRTDQRTARRCIGFSLSLFLAALCTTSGASARHGKPIPPALYQQLLQCQLKALAADEKLLNEMKAAARILSDYQKEHGRYPIEDKEVSAVVEQLLKRAASNSYYEDEVLREQLAKEQKPVNARVEFRIEFQPSLSAASISDWTKHPPDSWQASPGTISILHNADDLAVLWCSGADCRPIKDSTTGDAKLLLVQNDRNY